MGDSLFFAANYLTSVLEQNLENLEALNPQFDANTALVLFAEPQVNIEIAQADSLAMN